MAHVPPTSASSIARFLQVPLCGEDLTVDQVNSLATAGPGALVFLQKYSEAQGQALNRLRGIFVLADPTSVGLLTCSHVVVADPRLAFARVAQRFFEPPAPQGIAPTAQVSPEARIGRHVSIGHFTVIDADVEIGDDTEIADHVVIRSRTRIGKRGVIRSHAVIGESGFGFDFDEQVPVRIPHFGGVILGDDVQIGCGTIISCATLDDTVIEDHVKIDNLVVVAHNCFIGRGTIVTGGAVLCGRARIGSHAWIGANSTIREGGVQVGEGALVGLGAVVLASIEPRHVAMGNPARVLRKRGDNEEF